jgi:hypothetical protein
MAGGRKLVFAAARCSPGVMNDCHGRERSSQQGFLRHRKGLIPAATTAYGGFAHWGWGFVVLPSGLVGNGCPVPHRFGTETLLHEPATRVILH